MSFHDFSVGQGSTLEFVVTEQDMNDFRVLSGDTNPVHADDDYARALGFDSRIVFGALIVAKISALIGVRTPGEGFVWTGLKIDFRNPLYLGERVTLTTSITDKSDAAAMLVLKVRAATEQKSIATGTAELVFRGND